MSAYPMRLVDPPDVVREHVAELFDHVATAIRGGYHAEMRARVQWALSSLQALEPGAVLTIREQVEDTYPDRIQRCQTVHEALALHDELLALYHTIDQLDFETLAHADVLNGKDE